MEIIIHLHSVIRWGVVLVAILALTMNLIVWIKASDNGRAAQVITRIMTSLIDLQLLLGLLLFVWMGAIGGWAFPRYRFEHAVTMIIAVALVHLSARWKSAATVVRARNTAILIALALVLIWWAVHSLPKGWAF